MRLKYILPNRYLSKLWTCASCQWRNDVSRKSCGNCKRRRGASLKNVAFINDSRDKPDEEILESES